MSELIAIDVLLEPDDRVHDLAISYNRRFLRGVPPPRGFELGESRVPHVTVVQRYVRSDELTAALASVELVAVATDPDTFDLVLGGAPCGERFATDGVGTVLWWVTAEPALLELQSSLLAALEPFVVTGGDGRSFVRAEDDDAISNSTIRYVERFVPDQIGSNYRPHLTLGRADAAERAQLAAHPAPPIRFTSPAVAVHHLGDHGTARRMLARWPR